MTQVSKVVQTIGNTVVFLDPWDKPEASPLNRTWCLWELFHTVQGGHNLDVIMTPDKGAQFKEALGTRFEALQTSLSTINVEKSQTTVKADRNAILKQVGRWSFE